jgi:hypothetical protein
MSTPILPARRVTGAWAVLALAGAALADGTWLGTSYCTSTPNSTGGAAAMGVFGPDHGGTGLVFMDDPVVLSASPVPAGCVGLFLFGQAPAQVPFGEGFLCVSPPLHRLPPTVAVGFGAGTLEQSLTFSRNPAFAPGTWYLQAWFRDPPGGPTGHNSSDGIELEISP